MNSAQTLKNDSARRSSVASSIFDRLHDESYTKLEIKQMNEQIRKKREMQHCTFQPKPLRENVNSSRSNHSELYERLAQSNVSMKQQYYESQKIAIETKNCTFQPSLPKAKRSCSRKSHKSDQSFGEEDAVYERLHRQAEIIDQEKQSKAIENKEHELDGCTFAPTINGSTGSFRKERSLTQDSRFDSLYQEGDQKSRKLAKKRIQEEERQQAQCTFKPRLESQSRLSFASESGAKPKDDAIPRYERLYNRHAQKEKMLEQKRKELAEEEKKMRQFVAKQRRGPGSSTNVAAIAGTAGDRKSTEELGKSCVSSTDERHEAFDRLYSFDKVYKKKKDELSKKVMQEMGVSFTPRTNSVQGEVDSKGVIERNEEFLKNRNTKLSKQVPTGLRECTFVPKVRRSRRNSATAQDTPKQSTGERLYAYFEKYEKKREDYRQKHLDD